MERSAFPHLAFELRSLTSKSLLCEFHFFVFVFFELIGFKIIAVELVHFGKSSLFRKKNNFFLFPV